MHISVFLTTDVGSHHRAPIEIGLHKAPVEKELCKQSPIQRELLHIYIHTYAHFGLSSYRYQGCFTKPL